MRKDFSSRRLGRSSFRDRLAPLIALASMALLVSCAKGPTPIKPGTPAFFWAVANDSYKAADYIKTSDALSQLTVTANDYTARARVWQIVVSGGLAKGFNDVADAYDEGRRFSRKGQQEFRERVRTARVSAGQHSMEFAETFRQFLDADQSEEITFAFGFPPGTSEAPPQLAKLGKGLLLLGAEADAMQSVMLQRGVRAMAATTVGVDDAAKAAGIFQSGSVARSEFLAGMAAWLYDSSDLYGAKKLDQPQKLKAFCILAQTALSQVPANRKTKELEGKLKKKLGKPS